MRSGVLGPARAADDTMPMALVSNGRFPISRTATVDTGISPVTAVLFIAAHLPLAIVMDYSPAIATVHAALTLALAVWWSLSDRLDRVIAVLGYIAGAEVLWRMTDAGINWEFAKYAAAGILLLNLLRHGRSHPAALPFAYFALLLPSSLLTLNNEEWSVARDQLSFNLSGPFALMVCGWFFSRTRLSLKDVRRMSVAMIAPAVGVGILALFGTFTASDLVFIDSSNVITSGGFGPNQVSAVLGLGALLAFFLSLDSRITPALRLGLIGILIGLVAQSALTFSRGGLYIAGGSAAVAVALAVKDSRVRTRLVPVALGLIVIGNFFLVPYLEAFTGGQLGIRFQDTSLTGRDRLIRGDIAVWKDNPLLGVGPGEGKLLRGSYFTAAADEEVAVRASARKIAAHTEFSRMLSEHGVFGLGSLLLFVAAAVLNIRRATDVRIRMVVGGLTCWSTLFMLSNAMRILAPSLMFAVGFAQWLVDPADEATQPEATGLRPLMTDREPTAAVSEG